MRLRAAWVGAAVVALSATSSAAVVRITDDVGGRIGTYVEAYSAVRSSGDRVMIDGACLSACTLVLAMLGFHAAWMPGPAGRPVASAVGTQALWEVYPAHLRRWINSRGGLSSKMIFLRGRELASMYPACR